MRTRLLKDLDNYKRIADEALWRLSRLEAHITESWQIIAREPRPAWPKD